jgi:hypothetical protein
MMWWTAPVPGPSLPFVALQRDVGNAGMSGLKADIANVTRLTRRGHFFCAAKLTIDSELTSIACTFATFCVLV